MIEQLDLQDPGIVATYRTTREAAAAVNGSRGAISECLNGKRSKHRGYRWRTARPVEAPPPPIKAAPKLFIPAPRNDEPQSTDGTHRLQTFLDEYTTAEPGRAVTAKELRARFADWLPAGESLDSRAFSAAIMARETEQTYVDSVPTYVLTGLNWRAA